MSTQGSAIQETEEGSGREGTEAGYCPPALTYDGHWLPLDGEQNLDRLGVHSRRVPLLSVVVGLDCKRALKTWMGWGGVGDKQ